MRLIVLIRLLKVAIITRVVLVSRNSSHNYTVVRDATHAILTTRNFNVTLFL